MSVTVVASRGVRLWSVALVSEYGKKRSGSFCSLKAVNRILIWLHVLICSPSGFVYRQESHNTRISLALYSS